MNSRALALIIFLLGIIAAVALFFFMQFGPYQEANTNLDSTMNTKRAYEDSLRQVTDVSEKIEQYKARLRSMEGLVLKAEEMVPKIADRNEICELLIEISHQADVTITSSTPSLPLSSGDGTGSYMIPIAISVEANYSKLGKFLDLLANNQRILKISAMSISGYNPDKNTIMTNMTVNAYYLPSLTTTQTSADAEWSE